MRLNGVLVRSCGCVENKPASPPEPLAAASESCGSDPFLAKLVGKVIEDAPVSNRDTTALRLMLDRFLDDRSVLALSGITGGALSKVEFLLLCCVFIGGATLALFKPLIMVLARSGVVKGIMFRGRSLGEDSGEAKGESTN